GGVQVADVQLDEARPQRSARHRRAAGATARRVPARARRAPDRHRSPQAAAVDEGRAAVLPGAGMSNTYEIKHRWTGGVLYDGGGESLRDVVVQAVNDGASLVDASLADSNLAGAYLAGANLVDAYLAGANLAGADLAGSNLAGA